MEATPCETGKERQHAVACRGTNTLIIVHASQQAQLEVTAPLPVVGTTESGGSLGKAFNDPSPCMSSHQTMSSP